MKTLLVVALFLSPLFSFAQQEIKFRVVEVESKSPIAGVSVTIAGTKRGGVTDSSGRILVRQLPTGTVQFQFSHVGFRNMSRQLKLPSDTVEIGIELEKLEEEKLDEVVVSSSRTESRIENLPTKVEVLGAEEVNEEVGIKPGNIASLLGDVAGIQTQQTSAVTGNMEMRVQGLPGKYTQLLKDGMPLFSGYSGSFSVLQIPPLDLKQIEIVKGSSSTLYGGGAIAGMINLVSKRPKEGVFEKTFLLNQSTLKESNVNVFLSNRHKKLGYTFFTGFTRQAAVDVNKDGFSDLPKTSGFFLHPVLFYYPNSKNLISLGFNGTFEDRKGGYMPAIKSSTNAQPNYFVQNKTNRDNLEFNWENQPSQHERLTIKGTTSWLSRRILTNSFGMKARQLSYYAEASYLSKLKRHDIVTGITLLGEDFSKHQPDSTQFPNYTHLTVGAFVQDDWKLTQKLILETGLRYDHHNKYGNFLLPRFSLLYKLSDQLSSRIGGGLGYKIPTLFDSELNERDYPGLLAPANLKAERSAGLNFDINYHRRVNGWDITVNQLFYFTQIRHPIQLDSLAGNHFSFSNADGFISTRGLETYVQLHHDALEIYLGYTLTLARKNFDDLHPHVSLSARNKFASVLAYEFSDHVRAGIEAAYTGRQYLDDGRRTSAYPFVAAMFRYDLGVFSFVANVENLFDYRQTRQEQLVSGTAVNPRFAQLWAPIDGRVVNFSVRLKL